MGPHDLFMCNEQVTWAHTVELSFAPGGFISPSGYGITGGCVSSEGHCHGNECSHESSGGEPML
jgi:hypothetical protein